MDKTLDNNPIRLALLDRLDTLPVAYINQRYLQEVTGQLSIVLHDSQSSRTADFLSQTIGWCLEQHFNELTPKQVKSLNALTPIKRYQVLETEVIKHLLYHASHQDKTRVAA